MEARSRPNVGIDFLSGMASGASVSALLNPWDRGIYLSIKFNRSFFLRANFINPYHGAMQSIAQRSIFGSGYYIAQGQLRARLEPYLRSASTPLPFIHYVIGASAGFTHGLITHPMAIIKAHTWGNVEYTFIRSIRIMHQANGLKAFSRGISASIARDMVHGSTYELIRHFARSQAQQLYPEQESPHSVKLLCDTSAAFVGTTVSSPFNHARTLKFATLAHQTPPTIAEAFKAVWTESNAHRYKRLGRILFFQSRFCIGIGTLRAAVGMGLMQQGFDFVREQLSLKT